MKDLYKWPFVRVIHRWTVALRKKSAVILYVMLQWYKLVIHLPQLKPLSSLLAERFAFIFDSAPLEFAANQEPCNLITTEKLFENFGYGLALRKNSPFTEIFNLEILKYRQNGYLEGLSDLWFGGTCNLGDGGITILFVCYHGPLTRYVTLWLAHVPGMPGAFPRHRFQRKPLVSDPGMHHGTCDKHVPWCMSGWPTGGGDENVPGIPGAYATRNFTYLVRGPFHKKFDDFP